MPSLKKQIKKAAEAYYEGTPIMEDAQYDAMVDLLRSKNESEGVGGGYTPESRKREHLRPMLSLDKVNDEFSLRRWYERVPDGAIIMVDKKWDGLSLELVYDADTKEMIRAVTRGDGLIGEDVTINAKLIQNLPNIDARAKHADSEVVVYGEVMLPKAGLEFLNSEVHQFSNTRNAAAGIIRRIEETEDARQLIFMEHDVPPSDWMFEDRVTRFSVDHQNPTQFDAIYAAVLEIGETRSGLDVDIDGAVIKVMDPVTREEMGQSSTAPRWAVAYKYESQSAQTILRDIVWQVGRSGRLVPVAEFDAVELVGASITRATMHNYSIFEEFGPTHGATITISRAGDVIPYISGIEDNGGERFWAPTNCPVCEAPISLANLEGVDIRCENNCQVDSQVLYAFRQLGVDGVGPGAIRDIIQGNIIDVFSHDSLVDILFKMYQVTPESLEDLSGWGESSANKTTNAIRTAFQNADDAQWLAALGIKGIGYSRAWDMTDSLTLNDLVGVNADRYLSDLPGIGPTVVETMTSPESQTVINNLIHHLFYQNHEGIGDPRNNRYVADEDDVVEDDFWTNKNVVVTGTLPDGITRNDAFEWLESRGVNIQGSVSGKTDLLIAGEKAGSKLVKAENLGIQIMDGDEFMTHYSA